MGVLGTGIFIGFPALYTLCRWNKKNKHDKPWEVPEDFLIKNVKIYRQTSDPIEVPFALKHLS